MLRLNNGLRIAAVLAVLILAPQATAAARYLTTKLQVMAEAMDLTLQVDTLGASTTLASIYDGFPVVVDTDAEGRVSHIGYSLFPAEVKNSDYGDALRFVERYVLEADLPLKREKSVSTQLAEDEVEFSHGDISDIRSICRQADLRVSVAIADERTYSVRWTAVDGPELLEMRFPVSHNLLLGASDSELYAQLYTSLVQLAKKTGTEAVRPSGEAPQIDAEADLVVESGKFYLIEQLNNDRYYVRNPEQYFELANDQRYPVETLSNMLVTTELPSRNWVEARMVDIKDSQPAVLPLTRFTTYMAEAGCEPYFGLIGIDGTRVSFMLLFKNERLGYAHSMRGTADLKDFPATPTRIYLRMLTYIPISRISNLFYEYQ